MKTVLWIIVILFLAGNAFFILPVHLTSGGVTSSYYINYKKDTALLHEVFQDNKVTLRLNMPPGYAKMTPAASGVKGDSTGQSVFVNMPIYHNLDFTTLLFPFLKVTSFDGVIPFYSIIRTSADNSADSTALVGNIVVNGKVKLAGFCTPMYVRSLVEKELVSIVTAEMARIEKGINQHPVADTMIIPEVKPAPVPVKKHRR